jgi:hypothetical protein
MKSVHSFAPTNQKNIMLTTIENQVTKKSEKVEVLPSKEISYEQKREASKQYSNMLPLVFALIGFTMIIGFSLSNDKLFFKELVISSSIIISLMFFKAMDSASN